MSNKIKIFMSYAHEDEDMKNELDVHFAPLKRMDKIDVWNDREIMAGDTWGQEISEELNNADIILLLISPSFNNSEYIWNIEIKRALERHAKKEVRVIPIIFKECFFDGLPYAKLQALPTGAKPISTFKNRDTAYLDVVMGVNRVVDFLQTKKS